MCAGEIKRRTYGESVTSVLNAREIEKYLNIDE